MTEAFGTVVLDKDTNKLGIIASFKKRYITLAPVAGLVGLAFNLKDPNNLLKGIGSEGITIALLERDHKGLELGKRHDPLVASFMNGTVEGTNVFIPMDNIVGGQQRCGFGWNMLMDCLAEGRAVSLPSAACAVAINAVAGVGAYARIRKQFKVPLANMGGVQEALGRIGKEAYIMLSAHQLINSILSKHEQPAVLSAIMKYEMTSRARVIINDAMDIMGGSAICRGKSNLFGNGYMNIPISITVEGANILTRSLIIFGQGLTRAHPHLLTIIKSLENGNDMKSFKEGTIGLIKHFMSNGINSIIRSITRPRTITSNNLIEYYNGQLSRLAANFAFCSDVALILGGRLKFEEMLSARFADCLGSLFLGYACLWNYQHNRHINGIDKLLEISMESLLQRTEHALIGISDNFPLPQVKLLKTICFPTGINVYNGITDKMIINTSDLITNPTEIRNLLSENIFISNDPNDKLHKLLETFPKAIEMDKLLFESKKTGRALTISEIKFIDEVKIAIDDLIQVDSFDKLGIEINADENYIRPALRNTKFENMPTITKNVNYIKQTVTTK